MIILLLIAFWWFNALPAQSVQGYIFNERRDGLPGANIYLEKTNTGTISNTDGFFILKVQPGKNTIIISYIGYNPDTLRLDIAAAQTVKKNITLYETFLQAEGVYIFAETYNDAQAIVRKTLENKQRYLASIRNYEYASYQKTIFKIDAPFQGRIIGGILETRSKGFFEQPSSFQEIVLAKRQTRNFSKLTNVFTVGRIPNLLDETLLFDEITVMSPLNNRALDYYNFEMIDTTFHEHRMVFNMKFSPKRSGIPLFTGRMSIIDKDFAVVACDMDGGDLVITNFRDSIAIGQRFRQFQDKFWFPIEMRMNCRINVNFPGMPYLYWKQHALISDYVINRDNFAHSFDESVLSYNLLSDAESDSLWRSEQMIALNREESRAYQHIDSVVTRAGAIKKAAFWSMENFDRLLITGFYDFYHFNRVQGSYFGAGFDSRRAWKSTRLKIRAGYGVEDRKPAFSFSLQHDLIPDTWTALIDAQQRLQFADALYRYNPTDITTQAILRGNDYADYYYKRSLQAGTAYQVFPHIRIGAEIEHSRQTKALNQISTTFGGDAHNYRHAFPADEGFINIIKFSLAADNLKYFDYGWLAAPDLSQNFYDVQCNFLFSPKRYFKSDYEFNQLHLYMSLYKKFPPWFHVYLRLVGGQINGHAPLQYYFHLAGVYGSFGNPILFRTIRADQFLGDRYLAVALENNFKNTLFSLLHLPLLGRSKLELLVFGNAGWIHNRIDAGPEFNEIWIYNRPLTEAGFSIGNVFTFFRFDFAWRLTHKTENNFSFRISSRLFIR
jgi:hypothetical protein